MALVEDMDGVTHLIDIFDGGTWCGRDLYDMEDVNDHVEPTCPACRIEEDDDH
jgi:hypothetical protein